MAKPKPSVNGRRQADGLVTALKQVAGAPRPGSRDLHVITGIKPGGGFIGTQENTLICIADYLAGTERVFKHGDAIVYETRRRNGKQKLVPLTEGSSVVSGADHRLANLMVCDADEGQFPVSGWLAGLLLRSEVVIDRLPEIEIYARRPVFDDHFVLRGPGWHKEPQILVHGQGFDPVPWAMPPTGVSGIDCLPPSLKGLLRGFCFRSGADLANTLAMLLTVLLAGRYIHTGKPIALIDGNQPNLGKTYLVRVLGVLSDGKDYELMTFTADEEELHKRLCAHLRKGRAVLGLDNAKVVAGGVISSPALESLVTSPCLALRILGKSELFERPNDLLWCLTMNNTQASPDLVSRGLPIRLAFEGNPRKRKFDSSPAEFALKHRREILGELAGMVMHWNAEGRPSGVAQHRFERWGTEVGGILAACGVPDFLANLDETAGEFSAEADELAALAEYALAKGGPGLGPDPRFPSAKPLGSGEWVPHLVEAGGRGDNLSAAKSKRSKEIIAGRFLAPSVDRTVHVSRNGVTVGMTLRQVTGRGAMKKYHFEIDPGYDQKNAELKPKARKIPPPLEPTVEAPSAAGNAESWG